MSDASADYDMSRLPTIAELREQLAASRDPVERHRLKALLFVDTYGVHTNDGAMDVPGQWFEGVD